MRVWLAAMAVGAVILAPAPAAEKERTEHFDADPNWEGVNSHATRPDRRTVRQDFGYSPTTAHAGGKPGEIGGFITPAAEPAYYGQKLDRKTLADPLTA